MKFEDKEYRLIPYEPDDTSDHVSLYTLFSTVWSARKTVLFITAAFAFYGVLHSLAAPEEFTSGATMMPETEERLQLPSLLQQFGGLVGQGMQGGTGERINVSLYPEIIYSSPAMHNLIYQEIYVPSIDSTVTVRDYMNRYWQKSRVSRITGGVLDYTIHLPVTLLKATLDISRWASTGLSGNDGAGTSGMAASRSTGSVQALQTTPGERVPAGRRTGRMQLTLDEYHFMLDMKDRIRTHEYSETGLFEIEVRMPDPEVAAQVAESIIDYLTDYITEYRTERLVRNLEFINERYEEAEQEYLQVQQELAEFRDRNINISTARHRTEEQRLESKYMLKFDLYNSIAQRREEARIRLQEETPVVKIMEPVGVPSTRSSPRRMLTVIMFTLLGGLVSLLWIYVRNVTLQASLSRS